MQLRHGDWIVVGDGEKALVFANQGDADLPVFETLDVLEQDLPSSNSAVSDVRPAEAGEESDARLDHDALRQHKNWKRIEKTKFAKSVADALYKAAHAGRFSRLVLVAPPRTLGDLRRELHQAVSERIVAEIDKNLTNHPPDRIEKLLVAA